MACGQSQKHEIKTKKRIAAETGAALSNSWGDEAAVSLVGSRQPVNARSQRSTTSVTRRKGK
jgi:hypothetical protein